MRTVGDVHFDALRNAIYHSARRSYYDFLNRGLSLVIVASGTGAVANLGANYDVSAGQLAFIAALAGLFQLVFDLGGKARTHEFLQRRFYELAADISGAVNPSPENVATWDAALNRLYAEEPPPMRAMDAIAYNAALEALGRNPKKRIKVNFAQSWLRHFFAFNGSKFDFASSEQ